jgi:phosphatidylserine/phosphatidylglycerophosphate/cardiolipin synthase-like enzyme
MGAGCRNGGRLRRLIGPALLVAALATACGSWPALAADTAARVTLLPNREYGEALLSGIRQARTTITFCFFVFKLGEGKHNIPRQLVTELVTARRRGVDVTVLLEQDDGSRDRINEQNRQVAAELSRGGVKVIFDSPRTTTHVKAAVIDRRLVFLGSHNLTQSALRHNNELSVLIDSPETAAEVLRYLNRL